MSLLRIADLLEQIVQELRSDQADIDKTVIYVPPKPAPVAPASSKSIPPPSGAQAAELTLEDLQKMGKSLIQDGRADELKAMLTRHGLKSLSSASKDKYALLYGELSSF